MERRCGGKDSDSPHGPLLSAVVLIGVGFFVIGFLMTVSSLSNINATSSGSSSNGLTADADDGASFDALMPLIGLTMSLAGVVAATAAPAAFYLHGRKRSS